MSITLKKQAVKVHDHRNNKRPFDAFEAQNAQNARNAQNAQNARNARFCEW